MAGLLKKIEESKIDRRKFIGLAAAAGVVASLGLTGCDNKLKETDEESPTVDELTGGKWIPMNCFSTSCNFRCYNKAYVADGIILRQGTDDTHPDSEDFPQQRGCLKGRSARKIVVGAERLKYPMKRKSWQPGGGDNINGQLRGIDEWERITWDEAVQYVTDEILRIRDTYGNRAFLATGQSDNIGSASVGSATLNLIGGCLTTWGQASRGGLPVVGNQMRGHFSLGVNESLDRMSLRHSKLMVMWGFNPAWMQSSGTMYHFVTAKKISGMKVILVDPFFNPTAQALADEWVPCRPGTDGALLEAIAYEMIVNDWQDQDFLDRCCLGFDADHMPEDAKTNENFKDYILGAYDGQPKTAEWASPICGASVEVIKDLAKQMATTKPMSLKAGQAPARTHYGNRFAQLFYTVGWMTGNVGIEGGEVTAATTHFGAPKSWVAYGGTGYDLPPNPICKETRNGYEIANGRFNPETEYGFPFAEVFQGVVKGEYSLPGPSKTKRACDIKCIFRDNTHGLAVQVTGGQWAQEAYRKVEFVLVHDLFHVWDAQYADIVLPAQSSLEMDLSCGDSRYHENKVVGTKVIEPYYEGKADSDIFFLYADKLGIGEDVLPRMSVKQAEFNKLLGATVVKTDGQEYEPLLTISEQDMKDLGVEGTPQEGRIPLKDFLEKGIYQIERSDGDNLMFTFNKAFREDPDANPVKTKSGKYEIYCQSLKDYYEFACFHDIDALPKYKPAEDGYEQTLTDRKYPLQFYTPHINRQAHSMWGNVKQLNEVYSNDLTISEYDADKLGLKKGDWAQLNTVEGGLARRINVVPNLMPGVCFLGQGNWRDIDQKTGVDLGGNVNSITRTKLVGDAYQAYNTVVANITSYTGTELLPDYQRPPIIPLTD